MRRNLCGFCLLQLAGTALSAQAPPPLTGAAYRLAEEAYRQQRAGDLPAALRSVDAALEASPHHPQLLRLKLDLLLAAGSLPAAEELLAQLSSQSPGNLELALLRVHLRQQQGRPGEAAQAARDLLADPATPEALRRQARLALAYACLSLRQDAAALEQFSSVLDAQSPPGAWLDAGYAAKRLGRNAEAARLFSRGLDARTATGVTPAEPAQDYGLRREVESLQRTWGAVLSTAYRQGGLFPGVALEQRILQQGLEASWQPESLARNGRLLQVFVQGFETLHNGHDGTTGGPTVQGAAGLRVKPFASENLVLAAQKLFPGGRYALDDWLFRAAYSRDRGLDLRPWQEDWSYWSVYTEGDAFARSGHYIHQAEVRAGHSWRLPGAEGLGTLSPHLVLAGDYDNRLPSDRTAAGLGAGLSLRRWFRQDAHRAPASWIDLTLQARARLNQASRGGGLFITLTTSF